MNKIKFLVCNINKSFPTDINEMIFKMVQERAAKVIQNMYYLRIKVNLDFFSIITYNFPRDISFSFPRVKSDDINKIIMYFFYNYL